MIKKITCIFILIAILSSLYSENICKPLKIKLKDDSKKTIQILCLGQKGMIAWNSTIPYKPELLNKCTEYIPYDSIKYIQPKNSFSFTPVKLGFSIGVVFLITSLLGTSKTSEGTFYQIIGGFILFSISFAAGIAGSVISILIPRHHEAKSFSKNSKTNYGYIMYITDLPVEIAALLQKFEK